MTDIFTASEEQIVTGWFERHPSGLAFNPKGRPFGFTDEHNAMAQIVLQDVQDRLPQWMGTADGHPVFGRDEFEREDRKLTMLPQFLFGIDWAATAPGFSWPEFYYVAFIPVVRRHVVTASQDCPDAYGYTDAALGWFEDGDQVEESKRTLQAWWNWQRTRVEQEAWEAFFEPGLVTREQALAWREEVWNEDARNPVEEFKRALAEVRYSVPEHAERAQYWMSGNPRTRLGICNYIEDFLFEHEQLPMGEHVVNTVKVLFSDAPHLRINGQQE